MALTKADKAFIKKELDNQLEHILAKMDILKPDYKRAMKRTSNKGMNKTDTQSKSEDFYSCSCPRLKCLNGKKWRKGGRNKKGVLWGLAAHKENVLNLFNTGNLKTEDGEVVTEKPVFRKL
tara:strand:- start:10 stop:372 length:363 start_codon:yes stop_codon:yes gene_type:complete